MRVLIASLALLCASCIATSSSGYEPKQRVLLEKRSEDLSVLRYHVATSPSGVPQIVRSRSIVEQVAHLGLRVSLLDSERAKASALTPWRGVLVDRVEAGSAAARAGIVKGDVLLSLDGIELSSPEQLAGVVQERLEPDADVVAGLLPIAPDSSYPASGTTKAVTLGKRLVTTSQSDVFPLEADEGVFHLTGLQVGTISAELVQEIWGESEPRVLVADARVGSPAYRAGLRYGDRLLACDGQPVLSHRDLSRALLARVRGAHMPADWFDASLRKGLPELEDDGAPILLEVDGPLGPHVAELEWDEDHDDRFEIDVPILYEYRSDVDSKRWSFLDFILQFGATYRGRWRESSTRAPESTWLFSMLPFGMFEFERTTSSTRYCFLWFIEFETHR